MDFITTQANVGCGSRCVVLANAATICACNLAPILRSVILFGQSHFSTGADCQQFGKDSRQG
ncbi:hypothetical protein JQT77_02720 [Sulfitobacter mediterraneus]|uniref:hypothetical protein n=1 Tax=Sulfitobacter mediterraneus TaxID=83219 RepID=UPI00193465BF|nr:hypothetical protein [Sulfitobacter mediterraneus]MBM1321336.1 hypothetical protein [Sulfitobacter mediterraneus]MBM1325223.1 hypothetical protein [Sulfitobacter mediterraneus]MBM1396570.1 hypothetical protein [Sulfitobacter mediterraneus]MBM1400454.1 hypothetical protein [Sulfitobacter mediterraneus]MBM1408229.1 hypothetical protein [Sulfitobacter mediterraneus]